MDSVCPGQVPGVPCHLARGLGLSPLEDQWPTVSSTLESEAPVLPWPEAGLGRSGQAQFIARSSQASAPLTPSAFDDRFPPTRCRRRTESFQPLSLPRQTCPHLKAGEAITLCSPHSGPSPEAPPISASLEPAWLPFPADPCAQGSTLEALLEVRCLCPSVRGPPGHEAP